MCEGDERRIKRFILFQESLVGERGCSDMAFSVCKVDTFMAPFIPLIC